MPNLTEILAQARSTQTKPVVQPKAQPEKAIKELTPEQQAMVTQLAEARELARIAKAHEETAKAAILEALGDAVLGTVDGKPVVQVNAGSRTDVDRDLLMQAFPEAFSAAKKVTSFRSIKVLKP